MWSVIPPGGWHIIENDTRIESETHDSLVEALAAYRNANNLPAGDPQKSVDNYILGRWPHVGGAGSIDTALADADKPQLCYGQPVRKKLSERLFSWCANRYSRLGSIQYVSTEEAERRANICIGCIANDPQWASNAAKNCPPCVERISTLRATLFKVRGGKSVIRESKCGACSIFGHDNQTAIWLTEDALRHAKHYIAEAPDNCWLKK